MSDHSATPARPVSLFTVVFLLAIFGAFLLVIRYFYEPATTSAVNAPAENLSKDLAWRADPQARRKALEEVREAAAKQSSSYAWIDKSAGSVQLPIERAMELTAQKYGAANQVRRIRDLPATPPVKF
ncbi:MAG: hypothetical protein EXS37_05715 [Opitutus sp.]|nr:hypothetical protein [Opitutus sp.]